MNVGDQGSKLPEDTQNALQKYADPAQGKVWLRQTKNSKGEVILEAKKVTLLMRIEKFFGKWKLQDVVNHLRSQQINSAAHTKLSNAVSQYNAKKKHTLKIASEDMHTITSEGSQKTVAAVAQRNIFTASVKPQPPSKPLPPLPVGKSWVPKEPLPKPPAYKKEEP